MSNWERELSQWLPHFRTVVYHGAQGERARMREELRGGGAFDVLLTTYTYFEREACGPDRAFLRSMQFVVMALDEAHSLKNAGSDRYRRLLRIPFERRVLLTGTPINNSLPELLCLLQVPAMRCGCAAAARAARPGLGCPRCACAETVL